MLWGTHFNCLAISINHMLLVLIWMRFYNETDKIRCNLKNPKLLDFVPIRICSVIRLNMVYVLCDLYGHNWASIRKRAQIILCVCIINFGSLLFAKRIIETEECCYDQITLTWFCLFVLRFYGPVNRMGSCPARSVYITTRSLGRLSPLSG